MKSSLLTDEPSQTLHVWKEREMVDVSLKKSAFHIHFYLGIVRYLESFIPVGLAVHHPE